MWKLVQQLKVFITTFDFLKFKNNINERKKYIIQLKMLNSYKRKND